MFAPHADASGDCVARRVLQREPWRGGVLWPVGFEAGLVHRLDNSTSGAVLAADSLEELAAIRAAFTAKAWVKTYRFVTARDVPWDENSCLRPIGHDARHKGRMVVQRGASTPHRGRWYPAETQFRRVRGRLFEAAIRTGVMHQIRVHAAFVGIALAGDRRYGGGGAPDGLPEGVEFLLHHVGMRGPNGLKTEDLPLPAWARAEI
jgi:23S rRNA-/tRNA-specific pseudouridylate synthase